MKGYKIGFSEIDDNGEPRLCYALIELEIPERYPGAKYFSSDYKNRSNVARVLKINKIAIGAIDSIFLDKPIIHDYRRLVKVTQEHLDSAFSLFDPNFCYRPGEIIYPDCFEDQPVMCANGIHFFTYRQLAIDYVMDDWTVSKFTERVLEKTILRPVAVEKKGIDFQ